MKKPIIMYVFFAFILAGCAISVKQVQNEHKSLMSKNYVLNKLSSASTGSPLVEINSLKYVEISSYIAIKDFHATSSRYTFRAGNEYQVIAESKDRKKKLLRSYDMPQGFAFYINDDGSIMTKQKFADGTYKRDKDGNIKYRAEQTGWINLQNNIPVMSHGDEPIGKLFKKSTLKKPLSDSFKCELIYSGNKGSSINLTYREYTDNLIRPAFTQNLTYDISKNKSISFKTLKLYIEKFDNSKISFKVVSDGGLPWVPRRELIK